MQKLGMNKSEINKLMFMCALDYFKHARICLLAGNQKLDLLLPLLFESIYQSFENFSGYLGYKFIVMMSFC